MSQSMEHSFRATRPGSSLWASAPQRFLASFELDTDDRKSQNRTERKSAGRCQPLDSAGAPAARRQAPGAFGLVASGKQKLRNRPSLEAPRQTLTRGVRCSSTPSETVLRARESSRLAR